MTAEAQIQTLCELPPGAVLIDVVEVCGYLAADGTRMFVTRFSRDAPLSTIVGLLRIGEHQILRESERWEQDEET